MIRLIILLCVTATVYAQFSDFFQSVPAILDSQTRLAQAVYGPGGLSSVATPFGAGFPFNAANNPAIQNYVQRTLNNALQQSPVNYLSYPQNNFVNPSKYVVSPQNNNPNYAIVPQNKPAPATRRPTFQYPDVKNSLNNANSVLKTIGSPGGGGLNSPYSPYYG